MYRYNSWDILDQAKAGLMLAYWLQYWPNIKPSDEYILQQSNSLKIYFFTAHKNKINIPCPETSGDRSMDKSDYCKPVNINARFFLSCMFYIVSFGCLTKTPMFRATKISVNIQCCSQRGGGGRGVYISQYRSPPNFYSPRPHIFPGLQHTIHYYKQHWWLFSLCKVKDFA